jgi:ATP-dependent RNA helicase DHX37/DHR1
MNFSDTYNFHILRLIMAGPPVRERYNAKARGSTAGGSHKKRKRVKPTQPEVSGSGAEDNNDGIPAVETVVDVDAEARGKMSSKRRKRLDSYIVSQ